MSENFPAATDERPETLAPAEMQPQTSDNEAPEVQAESVVAPVAEMPSEPVVEAPAEALAEAPADEPTDAPAEAIQVSAGEPQKPRNRFPHFGDLCLLVLIILLPQGVVGGIAGVVAQIRGWNLAEMAPEQQGLWTSVLYASSMISALIFVHVYRRLRHDDGKVARLSIKGLSPRRLLWGFLSMVALSVLAEPLLDLLEMPDTQLYGEGGWTILTLVVMAPIMEEILCRGMILESLRRRRGVVAAWLGSALIFGLIHVYPAAVVNAFLLGLILGYIYLVTDSLLGTIVLHAMNNGVAYLLMSTGHGEMTVSELIADDTTYYLLYGAAALLTLLSALIIARGLRRCRREEKNRAVA